MSSDSWQEVVSSTSSTHSATDDDHNNHDINSSHKSSTNTMPKLIVSDANIDEDVAGDALLYTLRGGLTLMFVIGIWMFGVFAPLLACGLLWNGGAFALTALAGLVTAAVYPYMSGKGDCGGSSPTFRHAIPAWGQYWHRSCGRVYEKEGPESWETMPPTVFCYHPHGVFTQAYILNGSLNKELPQLVGLLATGLYHAPVFRLVFGKWAGSAAPASKEAFLTLMNKGSSFGIVPGGFQEAALSKLGTDRVWMKNRKGFIKYALQYGYRLRPVFTFGESDTYWNVQGMWKLRLWMTANNVPAVVPWGLWWCPLLPRRSRLMTVFSEPIVLPKVQNPSKEDVDKWHAVYVEALESLHRRHKAKYSSNPEGDLEVW